MERSVGQVYDLARTMMIDSNAPPTMLEDATKVIWTILNECRLAPGTDQTPYELFHGDKPDYSNKIKFYLKGISHLSEEQRKGKGKMAPKAEEVRFIGYPKNYQDAFIVYNPKTKDEKVRHDVRWLEESTRVTSETANKTMDPTWPKTLREALDSPDRAKWIAAIKKELKALFELGTFRILDRACNQPMKSKFVFEVKKDGTYKCRLVACDYSQVRGKDYDETFSPTVAFKGICALLHECAHIDYEICTIDIGNAFLESKADKEIVMRLPPGFWEVLGQANKDVQVIGALYGLKQAGRLWYQKLVNILIDYGFTRSIYDPCIFYLNKDGIVMKAAILMTSLSFQTPRVRKRTSSPGKECKLSEGIY